jgi:hypothetical protein
VRSNWIESKAAALLFHCSAVILICLGIFAVAITFPAVQQVLNSSSVNHLVAILIVVLFAIGVPSMLLIFFGMAIFCAVWDRSSIGKKVLWYLLFVATGPIGSTMYYFIEYRAYIKRIMANGADFEGLHP